LSTVFTLKKYIPIGATIMASVNARSFIIVSLGLKSACSSTETQNKRANRGTAGAVSAVGFSLTMLLLSLSAVFGGGTRMLGCERRPGTTILFDYVVYSFVGLMVDVVVQCMQERKVGVMMKSAVELHAKNAE
jgi:hypothetical protein